MKLSSLALVSRARGTSVGLVVVGGCDILAKAAVVVQAGDGAGEGGDQAGREELLQVRALPHRLSVGQRRECE